MSYGFNLLFKEINSFNDAMNFALNISNLLYENHREFLEDLKYYIPSSRICLKDTLETDEKEVKNLKHQLNRCVDSMDNYWIYKIFNLQFIYWEEYKLLALVGDRYPKVIKKLFDISFYFQNSTDQDYPYKSWGNICCFNDVINSVKKMYAKEIFDNLDYMDEENEDISKIRKNLSFYRQCLVYDMIYKKLDLDEWLWNKSSNKFKSFCINPITNVEKEFECTISLKDIKNNLH